MAATITQKRGVSTIATLTLAAGDQLVITPNDDVHISQVANGTAQGSALWDALQITAVVVPA